MNRLPPRSTRTATRVPYTTLFRSVRLHPEAVERRRQEVEEGLEGEFGAIDARAVAVDRPVDADVLGHPVVRHFEVELARLDVIVELLVEAGGGERTRPAEIIFERQRSEEHTSELQSLMRISYAVF